MPEASPSPADTNPVDDHKMPLMAHLIELRQRLIYAMLAFIVCFIIGYAVSGFVFEFLQHPLKIAFAGQEGRRMIYTAPTEAFFTYMKVAFFSAVFISFPIVASQIWMFVAPGLYRHERSAFLPFLVATPFMFLVGAAFLYYLILPVALKFFVGFEMPQTEGTLPIQLEAKMSEYLSLVMTLILAFGISFELPVLLSLLGKVGIVTAEGLASKRRYAVVGMVAFAGVVTPPDVFSQVSLAVPMYILYEATIWIVRAMEKAKAVRQAAEEAAEEASAKAEAAPATAAAAPAAAMTPLPETDFNLSRS